MVRGVATQLGATLILSEPGSIPWTATRAWAAYHRLSEADEELLDHCIQAMDAEYRRWWMEKHANGQ